VINMIHQYYSFDSFFKVVLQYINKLALPIFITRSFSHLDLHVCVCERDSIQLKHSLRVMFLFI